MDPSIAAMQSIQASRAGGADTKRVLMIVLVVALVGAILFWPHCAGLCLFKVTENKTASGVRLGSVSKGTVGSCGLKALATKGGQGFSWVPDKGSNGHKNLVGTCTVLGNPVIGGTVAGAAAGVRR